MICHSFICFNQKLFVYCVETSKKGASKRCSQTGVWSVHVYVPTQAQYSRLTGFDALLIDRVVYYKFTVILRFLCTRKYLDASSLKHVVFMQK